MTKIGGVTLEQLKNTYQTPLYIFDEDKIREQCQTFKKHFKHPELKTDVIYASKAFLTIGMAELIHSEGLWLDCVSQGEVYTALKAGFPSEHIALHGNNKTKEELDVALQFKIGVIVLDNPYEADMLMELVNEKHIPKVMLRINPGIDAHTHDYIKTSLLDSKFGLSIQDPSVISMIEKLVKHPFVNFLGTHSHIGSQILEENSFYDHVRTVLEFYASIKEKTGINLTEVNFGGGFGIKYLESDARLDLKNVLPKMLEEVYQIKTRLNLAVEKVYIEPGRSIVGEAGYTLYTINQVKTTINGKNYMFIDGSMNDHIRTALYQAKYDALVFGKEDLKKNRLYTVAGKACESGDIIIHDILLPEVKPNDLLLVKSTGAYHYSMASHYNRLTIPAVVFVKDGKSKVIVKRESFMDLLSHDEHLV
ncbi:diaminopimelate decarboxylase [Acholeplasma equirhinis]|uniref:diaminopimelate decarboxylase n=1 Tax=Acholeplasma equirhinis TaxID=555393 RepID=UPI00197AFC54|nr:diaminopimelate decarboxylase [Acholeplasma equirhinis]MBN3490451.1 diaminopimelate decarboxylase [Acholeplasma equirhinis]